MADYTLSAKITADASAFVDGVRTALAELQKSQKEFEKVGKAIEGFGKGMMKAGAVMTAGLTVPLAAAGKGLIDYNAQIEQYTVALTTLTKDQAKAASIMEQIKRDAASTPFGVAELTQANTLLLSTGVSADDARKTIIALGDAVSATGGGADELARMAQNLQQVKNAGAASAADVKQFAMAGIDVYGILADYLGKTTEEVKEMQITYENLSGALAAASAEGGRYYDGMTNQSKTLNGQLSTLKDTFNEVFGEALQNITNALRDNVIPALQSFLENCDAERITNIAIALATVGPVLLALGGVLAFVGKLVTNMKTIIGVVSLASGGIKLLAGAFSFLASPIGLVIAAIAAVVASIVYLWNNCEGFRDGVLAIWEGITAFFTPAVEFFTQMWNAVCSVVELAWGIIITAVRVGVAAISAAFQLIWVAMSTVWAGIVTAIQTAIAAIIAVVQPIAAFFSGVFQAILNNVQTVFTAIGDFISTVITGIQNCWNGLKAFAMGVLDGVFSAVQSVVDAVKGFVNGVISGINAAIGLINMIPGVSVAPIPYLLHGTDNWAGGFARMNEGGRGELTYLPGGAQVIPHDISVQYAKEAARANAEPVEIVVKGGGGDVFQFYSRTESPAEHYRAVRRAKREVLA